MQLKGGDEQERKSWDEIEGLWRAEQTEQA